MATANTKSSQLTRLDATPPKAADILLHGGRNRVIKQTVAVAAADDNGSVYRTARVWSGWNIHSIRVSNDAITSGTGYDVGLYDTDENGGAAIDDDCYASTLDLSSAGGDTEVAFEARNIANAEQKVWQDAGLSEDPGKFMDICLTADAVGSADGDILVVIAYTDGT